MKNSIKQGAILAAAWLVTSTGGWAASDVIVGNAGNDWVVGGTGIDGSDGGNDLLSADDGTATRSVLAYPTFRGGVRVAAGDVN